MILTLLYGASALLDAGATHSSQASLQQKLNRIESTCRLGKRMNLRAMSPKLATIEFADDPKLPGANSAKVRCVAEKVQKLHRITLGFMGTEQYEKPTGAKR